MRESLYSVGSRKDPAALGGYAASDNMPKSIESETVGAQNALSIVALVDKQVPYKPSGDYSAFRGFQLVVVNRTGAEVSFRAQDSRIYIILQAQTPEGAWKPVEHLTSSSCGNSYHRVFLPDKHFWTFAVPVLAGSLKTKLRFLMISERSEPAYSNEFVGHINPAQWVDTDPDSLPDETPKLRLRPPPQDSELKKMMEQLR